MQVLAHASRYLTHTWVQTAASSLPRVEHIILKAQSCCAGQGAPQGSAMHPSQGPSCAWVEEPGLGWARNPESHAGSAGP